MILMIFTINRFIKPYDITLTNRVKKLEHEIGLKEQLINQWNCDILVFQDINPKNIKSTIELFDDKIEYQQHQIIELQKRYNYPEFGILQIREEYLSKWNIPLTVQDKINQIQNSINYDIRIRDRYKVILKFITDITSKEVIFF